MTGDEDNRHATEGFILPDPTRHREAVEAWHGDVGNDEIGRRRLVGFLVSIEAIDGQDHAVMRRKRLEYSHTRPLVIVDDEDGFARVA